MTDYGRAYGTAAELAAACVRQLQSELDGVPDSELEGYLRVAYAAIVKRYGKSAAQVAVEQYAETREQQQVAEAYEPTAYEPTNDGLLRWDVSDALSKGTETNPRVDLEALGRHSMRRTMEYADYTMDRNCAADPARAKWGLVPHAGACAWCVYIAGFGFTYNSEGTASRGRHSGCKCSLQVSFGDGGWPDGYDPDGMRERANSCRAAIESDARRAWDSMSLDERREVAGGTNSRAYQKYFSKRTVAEMRTRDADWLRTGKAPTPTFATAELEKEVKSKRSHELRTASRMCAQGVRADFRVDKVVYQDKTTGYSQTRGMADLANGYELKTLVSAASYNTIDSHLANASKKGETVAVVFDNTENGSMSDDELASFIRRSRRFSRGRVYILDGESYELIR